MDSKSVSTCEIVNVNKKMWWFSSSGLTIDKVECQDNKGHVMVITNKNSDDQLFWKKLWNETIWKKCTVISLKESRRIPKGHSNL